MKKVLSLLLVLVMVFALTACSSGVTQTQVDELAAAVNELQANLDAYVAQQTAAEAAAEEAAAAESTYAGELIVFAAASMTETLTEIGDLFMEANPDVSIVFNFDSSGTLKTQIQEGADCDVFISAGQKQMNQIDITADPEVNTEGLDFVLDGTRFDILENKVALAVPEGNPAGIESYDDLAARLADGSAFLAMGNEDVPVGQYTQKILAYYDLSEDDLAAAGTITYGSNVKEVTTQVSEATVDCGIIYATDAFSAGLDVVDTATADMCGQVIYPAAVLNTTSDAELAEAFLAFCQTPEASAIFEAVGFTPLA
jgi:molybdate transport system substrate-binding protein